MIDAVVISDPHLGSYITRTDDLMMFLRGLPETRVLVINGDLVDGSAVALPDAELAILDKLADLRRCGQEIRYVRGNHDWVTAPRWADLIGVPVLDETIIESGGKKFWVIHGHQWDTELTWFPWVTNVAIRTSRFMGHVSAPLARWCKGWEKKFRHLPSVVKAGAQAIYNRGGYDGIICGHTHVAEQDGHWYINDGSFCENAAPTACYVANGTMELVKPLKPLA